MANKQGRRMEMATGVVAGVMTPAAGTVQLDPAVAVLSVGVPLVKMLNEHGVRGFVKRRVDVEFTPAESETLRDLADGLRGAGVLEKSNPTEADALRWLMRKLEAARVEIGVAGGAA